MARIFALIFLVVWLVCAYALWLETVVDVKSAIEFAFLALPPTFMLVGTVLLSKRFAY